MSVNRATATAAATATGHRSTPSKSHSPGSGGASDSSNSRAATPIPISSTSKRGTIILGSGRGGGGRGTAGGLPVLGRRSKLRFGSSPGTPPQHGNADGGAAMTGVSHADRFAAELANTAREVVFAQSDKMSVTFSEALPTEVRGVIGRGDAWDESYSGGYDHTTGYAWTSSSHSCFLWKHTRALSGPPTTHIFPAPPTSQGQPYPPQVILLPSPAHPSVHAHSQISEPALILVSPTGQVRFWPSIFLGLAGGDKFTAATLPFQPDEYTSASARAGFNGAIIGSSRGRAFRISVTRKIDGEYTLTVSQLGAQQQSRGIFAYLTSFGGSPSSTGSDEPVAGLAVSAKAQDIWVLGTDKLSLWRSPNAEGSETLIAEGEIVASLQEEILKLRYTRDSITEREWDRKALELEIEVHDIILLSENSHTEKTTRSSVVTTRREGSVVIWEQGSALTGDGEGEEVKPILLVSFWGREGESDDWSGSHGVRRERLYATVGCRFEEDGSHPCQLLCFSKPDILPYADMNRNIRAFSHAPSVSRNVPSKDNTRIFVPRLIALQSPKNVILGVVFDGGLVLGSNGGPYKDHLFLRHQTPFPRSLGIGAEIISSTDWASAIIVYLTSMGSVAVLLDLKKIGEVDAESGAASQILSIMAQAIKYGQIPDNPFTFRFPRNIDGAQLMMAAQTLSREVLNSQSRMIPKALSTTQSLVERVSRLQWLMRFINDNAALSRMSEGCRWALCSDAEKVESAKALWARLQEDYKGEVPLLRQAIETYEKTRPGCLQEAKHDEGMDADMEVDNAFQEGPLDTIRAWVKWCTSDCAALVECIASTVRDGGARSALTIKGREPKPEINADVAVDGAAIVLRLVTHSVHFRRQHGSSVYGLNLERPAGSGSPWTADNIVLDSVVFLFEECARCSGKSEEVQELMRGLSTIICEGYKDRLAWVRNTGAGGGWTLLNDQFVAVRRATWKTLVRNESAIHAFKLAEDFADFRALVELCYEGTMAWYGPSSTMSVPDRKHEEERLARAQKFATDKVEFYIDQYKEQFAFEVYGWWIEHDMAHNLFTPRHASAGYLEKFFEGHDHARLSWLQEIGRGRWGHAANTLMSMAEGRSAAVDEDMEGQVASEQRLSCVQFMLSVGKLCQFAQTVESDSHPLPSDAFTVYDDKLELLAVIQRLREELESSLPQSEVGRHDLDLDEKVHVVVDRLTTNLDSVVENEQKRQGSLQLFRRLVHVLLDGRTIGLEDVIDVLTLKDWPSAGDRGIGQGFVEGLVLMAWSGQKEKGLPPGRKLNALRAIWRRVYICNNWNNLTDTTRYTDVQIREQLQNTALFVTLRQLYTGSLKEELAAKSVIVEGLILGPREAMVLPSDEELHARFQGSINANERQMLLSDLHAERNILDSFMEALVDRRVWEEVTELERQTRSGGADESFYEYSLGAFREVSEEMEVAESLGPDVLVEA